MTFFFFFENQDHDNLINNQLFQKLTLYVKPFGEFNLSVKKKKKMVNLII